MDVKLMFGGENFLLTSRGKCVSIGVKGFENGRIETAMNLNFAVDNI